MEAYTINHWMFLFFIFSAIGWLQESLIESLYHRRPVNRGFLLGPYIPIYGVGGILMLLVGLPFRDNAFLVFFAGMIGCTLLEYFTGWLMEKIFNKQFWDYSMMKFTYKNRISLISSLFWGALSVFMVYILFGIIHGITMSVDPVLMGRFNLIMLISMSADGIAQTKKHIDLTSMLSRLPTEQVRAFLMDKRISIGEPLRRSRLYFMRRMDRISGYIDVSALAYDEEEALGEYRECEEADEA